MHTRANGPIFTWLLQAEDGGTRLTAVVTEEDLSRWENLDSVSAVVLAKNVRDSLTAIKAGVEHQASPAA